MRFVVSKLRRTKKTSNKQCRHRRKNKLFGSKKACKNHQKIDEETTTKNHRIWSQNGAKSGPKTSQKSIKNVIEKRYRFLSIFDAKMAQHGAKMKPFWDHLGH